jgi:hypothetical protein
MRLLDKFARAVPRPFAATPRVEKATRAGYSADAEDERVPGDENARHAE